MFDAKNDIKFSLQNERRRPFSGDPGSYGFLLYTWLSVSWIEEEAPIKERKRRNAIKIV